MYAGDLSSDSTQPGTRSSPDIPPVAPRGHLAQIPRLEILERHACLRLVAEAS